MVFDGLADFQDEPTMEDESLYEGLYEADGMAAPLGDMEAGDFEDQYGNFEAAYEDFRDGIDEEGIYENGYASMESLYEDEYENDYEDEYEDEYEDQFLGGAYESGYDGEGTFTNLSEADLEADPFLGKLFKGVGRFVKRGVKTLGKVVRSPIFKSLARKAAGILGGVIGGPGGAAIANTIANAVIRESEMEAEGEAEAELYESDLEFEDMEGDYEAYALMEQDADRAAAVENELEASRHISRMVARTPQLLRRSRYGRNPKMRTVYPKVMRAVAALSKSLRAHPKLRWVIPIMPVVIRRTIQELARHRNIDGRLIIEVLSRNVSWALANRRHVVLLMRRRNQSRRTRRPGAGPMMRPGVRPSMRSRRSKRVRRPTMRRF